MKELIHLSTLDIVVVAIYVIVLIAIAYWASFSKKNKSDNLFTANKSLGWFAIGLTMWGTNVGPSMLIANASSGYESGIVDKFTFLLNRGGEVAQTTYEGGRPRKDDDQLTDAGLETREAGSNLISGGKV